MKNILLLGGSGSIGTQTIDVINKYNSRFNLTGISVGNRTEILEELIKKYANLNYFCLKNQKDYLYFKNKYPDKHFYYGDEGLLKIINECPCDMVVNALIGFVGFLPTIECLKLNKILCLSNKESLVVGGEIVNKYLKEGKGKLYPIDSEHVAISKCLYGKSSEDLDKILITASGGPFFFYEKDQFKNITPELALNHPTWKMGKKITIDSSTMMNKCFEIIEAHYLFNAPGDKIEPIVDRKSHVHSMVKFKNGDIYLQVGPSDMRIPIYYALNEGKCDNGAIFEDVEINTFDKYIFFEMDYEKFPLIKYAWECLKIGGNYGAVLNAANEVLVNAFLNNEINYITIQTILDKIMKAYSFMEAPSVEDLVKTDLEVRKLTKEYITKDAI